MNLKTNQNQKGFTIVELLIVIVVIAILAAISIVAFTGIQQRGRDSARASDVSNIVKAVTAYTTEDNGAWPTDAASMNTALTSSAVSLPADIASKVTFASSDPTANVAQDAYVYVPCTAGAKIFYLSEQDNANKQSVAGVC